MRPAPRSRQAATRSDGSWMRELNQLLVLAGIEPLRLLHTARTLPVYLRNYREYRQLRRRLSAGFPGDPSRADAPRPHSDGVGRFPTQALLLRRRRGAPAEDVAFTTEMVATDYGCRLGCAILKLVRVR